MTTNGYCYYYFITSNIECLVNKCLLLYKYTKKTYIRQKTSGS